MTIGIVGIKVGQTRVFTDEGAVHVTVVHAEPNRVTQLIDREYQAIQVTYGAAKAAKLSKPMAGQFKKANVNAGLGLQEFRIEPGELGEGDAAIKVGSTITVERFKDTPLLDVIGTSKGKGFAGVVKRHNFRMQDATHGNSLAHRAHGSTGQNQTPGRVFKGKKMAGQLGNVRKTIQNLELIKVDSERNLLLIKGAIPGPAGGTVIVKPAVKAKVADK